jgi:hypothetical protein
LAEQTHFYCHNASGQRGMSTKLPEESPLAIKSDCETKSLERLFLQQLFTVGLTITLGLQRFYQWKVELWNASNGVWRNECAGAAKVF